MKRSISLNPDASVSRKFMIEFCEQVAVTSLTSGTSSAGSLPGPSVHSMAHRPLMSRTSINNDLYVFCLFTLRFICRVRPDDLVTD